MLQIKMETANIWEYKVGNNVNIANFMCLWKTRMILQWFIGWPNFTAFNDSSTPLKKKSIICNLFIQQIPVNPASHWKLHLRTVSGHVCPIIKGLFTLSVKVCVRGFENNRSNGNKMQNAKNGFCSYSLHQHQYRHRHNVKILCKRRRKR